MSKRQKLIVRKAKAKSECGKNNSFALWCGRESNAMVDANGKERFSEKGSRVFQFHIWDASAKSLVLVLRIKIGIIHVANLCSERLVAWNEDDFECFVLWFYFVAGEMAKSSFNAIMKVIRFSGKNIRYSLWACTAKWSGYRCKAQSSCAWMTCGTAEDNYIFWACALGVIRQWTMKRIRKPVPARAFFLFPASSFPCLYGRLTSERPWNSWLGNAFNSVSRCSRLVSRASKTTNPFDYTLCRWT